MENVGYVSLVNGNQAIITLENNGSNSEIFNGQEKTNIIVKNKVKAREKDKVSVTITEKYSQKQRYAFYIMPLVLFLIGFGVGFIFKMDLAHFGLMIGLYGISLLITLVVKSNYEMDKYKYDIKILERAPEEVFKEIEDVKPGLEEDDGLEVAEEEAQTKVVEDAEDTNAIEETLETVVQEEKTEAPVAEVKEETKEEVKVEETDKVKTQSEEPKEKPEEGSENN